MDKFIQMTLMDKDVDIYCGPNEKFSGKVKMVLDGVVTLEKDGINTYVSTNRILSVWESSQAEQKKAA